MRTGLILNPQVRIINLQNIGVSASSSGQLITINSLSTGVTTYRASRPATATETIVLGLNPNGVETAAIGGTKHNNDVLTITVFDAGLSGGSKAKSYTVHAADTLATIASSLANKIASDSDLSALGITATAASTVVNLSSTSNNLTTYTGSVSAGSTESITLGTSTGITAYAYNNLNELTSTSTGGLARFQGTTNKPIKSATIDSSVPASLPSSTSFSASANLSAGSNAATVSAIDGSNNSTTNSYALSVNSGSSTSLTFDANGNMTSDGTNAYSWDAENRLIKIAYSGSGNYSVLGYDGYGHNVQILEYSGGTLQSTRNFVWSGPHRREVRSASGSITAQLFGLGEIISGTTYFFALDALGSTREMTNSGGAIQAKYSYDPFGRATQLQGTIAADMQFAGYYTQASSGLNLAVGRAFSANQGRWLSRDPMGESTGANRYCFDFNDPVNQVDSMGMYPERPVNYPLPPNPNSTLTTNAPGWVFAIGGHGDPGIYYPNGNLLVGGSSMSPGALANAIGPNLGAPFHCLIQCCFCHCGERHGKNPGYAEQLAKLTHCYVIGCVGEQSNGKSYGSSPTWGGGEIANPLAEIPQPCVLYDPSGNQVMGPDGKPLAFGSPQTDQDWDTLKGIVKPP